MNWIRYIHVTCALLSFTGFFIRGIWMLQDSPRLKEKWVKIAPHLIDTLLLVSALILAINLKISPIEHHWLLAKIIALLIYIGLGMIALHHGKTKTRRAVAWISGMLVFGYIVSAATHRSPWGILALIPDF